MIAMERYDGMLVFEVETTDVTDIRLPPGRVRWDGDLSCDVFYFEGACSYVSKPCDLSTTSSDASGTA